MTGALRPSLLVLAGVNGAGKSSIAGARLRAAGLDYFDPDEVTRQLVDAGMAAIDANALAWQEGRDRLQRTIDDHSNFAIETTLGGRTIPALTGQACASHAVTIWFVGLDSVGRHIARVAARAAAGGHAIPDRKIRARWNGSRTNLIALLPQLHELFVYDNSKETTRAERAAPTLLLHMRNGRIDLPARHQLARTPDWAKPIVEAALRSDEKLRACRQRS